MKLTLCGNFINNLQAAFCTEMFCAAAFLYLQLSFVFFDKRRSSFSPIFITNTNYKQRQAAQNSSQFHRHFINSFFHAKVICTTLICLQFWSEFFWWKEISAKAAYKIGEIQVFSFKLE